MVAGSGTQCNVKNLICKTIYLKSPDEPLDSSLYFNDKRGCDCCVII
jgi:hypothetical protein